MGKNKYEAYLTGAPNSSDRADRLHRFLITHSTYFQTLITVTPSTPDVALVFNNQRL